MLGDGPGAFKAGNGSRAFSQDRGIRIQLLHAFHCHHGSCDFFRIFQQSGLVARALAYNASIIAIRRLDDNTMLKIDAASSSFWAATQGNDQVTGLGMLERMRLRSWVQSAYEAIGTVNP